MKLHKYSDPGWSKDFATEAELKAELFAHICRECRGGCRGYVDDDGHIFDETFEIGPESSLDDMLDSYCGFEFDVEETST